MKMPVDENGKPIPVLPLGASQDIDGTSAHAETTALEAGVYRLAVVSATGDGVRVAVGDEAVAEADSTYMGVGQVEIIGVSYGHVISVLDGVLNITKLG